MIDQRYSFLSVLFIFTVIRFSTIVYADEFEIQYSIPRVVMKLIIVDDNMQIEQFKLEIDKLTQIHLVNFFMDELPVEPPIVNRNQFRSVTLTSSIERVPVDIQENTTSVTLSVMRSEYSGSANFSVSEDEVDLSILSKVLINNTTDLRLITFDAFRQRIGFWHFAELIKANNLLAVTGKLQIMVDNVIVGEADLENDNPSENDENGEAEDISRLTIVLICVICVLLACVGGLGALIWYLRHREYEFEKKSRERRETSKQVRMKSLGSSTSSFGNSIRSNGDVSLMINENIATDVAGVSKKLERKSSVTSLASYDLQVGLRGDIESKKDELQGDLDSRKNDSDESLLDSIANESTNLEYETTNQLKKAIVKNFQDDEDDSEFFSVQSASERDEYVDKVTNSGLDKNLIISSIDNNRPTKRNSHASIGTAPPMLKSAIKNSHEGRQYVTDTTRKYITYSNSMTSSFVNHSSPRSPQKFVNKNKVKHLSVPVSTKRGSITTGKSLLPPTLSPSRTSQPKSSIGDSLKTGINSIYSKDSRHDRIKNEAFDDGIMIEMSSSNLSFDILDSSNSEKASLSPGKIKTKDGGEYDGNQSSLSFCFT